MRRGCTAATSTQFTKVAAKNVKALAASRCRAGNDIVVPQPTCGYILKKDYVDYVGGADAELVAEHTYDAAEYLMKVHKTEGTPLDTDFNGFVPATITYHTPCHLQAQNIGLKSRDLIKLTGAQGEARAAVQRHRRHVGPARRERRDQRSRSPASSAEEIAAADGDVVAGDCHLANTAITEQTGECRCTRCS